MQHNNKVRSIKKINLHYSNDVTLKKENKIKH